jgi:hypothetical protein
LLIDAGSEIPAPEEGVIIGYDPGPPVPTEGWAPMLEIMVAIVVGAA